MQNVQRTVFIWTQTCRETFKSAFSVPLRLIHNRTKFYHSKELSGSCEILNLYRLNLLNTVVFIHKIKNRTACHHSLKNLSNLLIRIQHVFQAGIRKPQITLRKCRFWISIRDLRTLNDLFGSTGKEIQSSSLFKTKMKSKLVSSENEVNFFNTFAFKKLTQRSIEWW